LAKLTRRSQVRNSNLFIHSLFIYLFICLFISKTLRNSRFFIWIPFLLEGTGDPGKRRARGGRPGGAGCAAAAPQDAFMKALKLLFSVLRFRVSRVRKKGFPAVRCSRCSLLRSFCENLLEVGVLP
jgi:hypothetical protein